IIHQPHHYPITPNNHPTHFLIHHPHLSLPSKNQHTVIKITNEIIRPTYQFFNQNPFTKIHPPILTPTPPQRTTELFHTKYFHQ
ncbi:amino acid--tRNA ligase-related protein, partial [Staphylococcus warneri]|uniref:amino acid--tRNA ligase-related protein n=1 Tax=Staphylococcus warneri TaxID=1292 RepID=UPI0028CB968A